MSALPGREPRRRPILRGVRQPPRPPLRELRRRDPPRQALLRLVRGAGRVRGARALHVARGLHPPAPGRADPHREGRARRRAQAGHGALRRLQGLAGAPDRPGFRGGAGAAGRGPAADDGRRPPLRGHGEPGHGRRDHGAVRRAPRPRGPRGARVLCRAPDAGHDPPLWRRGPADSRRHVAHPHRPQLGRCGRALHRGRPPHGLHRRRPDHSAGGADGAARDPGRHPHHRRRAAARGGLRAGARAGAGPRRGAERAGGGLRGDGRRRRADALPGGDGAWTQPLRGP